MKKITLLLVIYVLAFDFSFCQNPSVKQWDKRFGGTNLEFLYSLQQTTDKGFILGGFSGSGISGDKTEANWDTIFPITYDYWIVKIDSLGNKQWDKRFGGKNDDEFGSLTQTADGGYILGGWSNSGVSGNKTQATQGGYDYWIIKIDSLGNKQWDKSFGGSQWDVLCAIRQTADGGFILGGWSESGVSGDKTQPKWGAEDYWIVKIDSLGNKQWDKDFGGGSYDRFTSLELTKDGGYILGGWSQSGISGDKTQPNWGGIDYWILKIDSLGNKLWDKDFGGTNDDVFYSLVPTADGGYILGGWSESNISGDKTQNTWGYSDFWIVKIDSIGDKEWDIDFGGTSREDDFGNISQTTDGGYLLPGNSYSPISGDKTENNLGQEQSWIIKTDSLGNKQWDKTLLTTAHDEIGLAIQTEDGCYVMANYTSGGIGGYKTQPAWNNSLDYWIIKFCDSTLTTSLTTPQPPEGGVSIAPNPVNDFINISFTLKEEKNVSVEVYDLVGRRVLSTKYQVPRQIRQDFKIDVSFLTAGIYFLKAGNEVMKFVRE